MTPEQKTLATLRPAREHAQRLIEWVEHNEAAVGMCGRGLTEYLRSCVCQHDAIEVVVEGPPVIGVVSMGGTGKPWLVDAMLASPERSGSRHSRVLDYGDAYRGLQLEGRYGSTVALRFAGRTGSPAPHGWPFRFRMLGLADIAAILVAVHEAGGNDRGRPLTGDDIATAYRMSSDKLSARPLPGLTSRDVGALQEALLPVLLESPGLRMLTASGYWQHLSAVAEHLVDAERVRLLALLWGRDPDLTALFERLSAALAELAYSAEIHCPLEAIVERHGASGLPGRHAESVVDCETLAQLGTGAGGAVGVSTRYGQRTRLARATVAALVAELAINAAPVEPLAPHVEIVEFPTPIAQADSHLPMPGARGHAPGSGSDLLGRQFAYAKAIYLFERAVRWAQLNCLVVSFDPVAPTNDALGGGIGDWIDRTIGRDPHSRERSRSSLFVVATRSDADPASPRRAAPMGSSLERWIGRLRSSFGPQADGDAPWPFEWVPGQRLGSLYIFQHPPGTIDQGSANRSRIVPAARIEDAPHLLEALIEARAGEGDIGSDLAVIERSLKAPDGGVEALLRALARVATTDVKQSQLRKSVMLIDRGVRARFARIEAAGLVGHAEDWRREIATVLEHRLGRVAEQGNLGMLVARLGLDAGELSAALAAGPTWDADAEPGARFHVTGDFAEQPLLPEHCLQGAREALAVWQAKLRRAARTRWLGRDIGMSQAIIEHIVDEITAAAARVDLEARIVEATARLRHGPDRMWAERSFASVVCNVINNFVEQLTLDPVPSVWHDPRLPPARIQQTARSSLAGDWRRAFSAMIDDNMKFVRADAVARRDVSLINLLGWMPASLSEGDL